MNLSAPWWLACYIPVKEVIKPVKIDGFPHTDELAFYDNLSYAGFAEQGNASRTGVYLPVLQKVVESSSRGKSAGGFSLNRLKNKELIMASGQESVVLAD